MSGDGFLARWSRLKRSGGTAQPAPEAPAAKPAAPVVAAAAPAIATQPAVPTPLPPVESLEAGADISAFMREGVEQALKRQALKKLLQDPRFNVMDGLDVYIADYSQPDPLPVGWLEKMNQSVRLGDYRPPEEEAREPAEAAGEAPEAHAAAPAPAEIETPQPDAASDTPGDGAPASRAEESNHRE